MWGPFLEKDEVLAGKGSASSFWLCYPRGGKKAFLCGYSAEKKEGAAVKEVQDFIDRLKSATSLEEQRRVFERAIADAGFRYYTYNIVKVAGAGTHAPLFVCSYPQDWIDHYLSEEYYTIDPLVAEGPRHQLPFRWNEVSLPQDLEPRQQRLYLEAADLGICNGLTIPIHGRNGDYAAINLIPEGRPEEQLATLDRQQHLMHLIALYYHSHSGNSLLEQQLIRRPSVLTRREEEVLTWLARGKSTFEVSGILSVTERTVLYHIENAKKKLNVTNRTHLVVKAAMEGLIHP